MTKQISYAARALTIGVVAALFIVSFAGTGAALSNSGGGSWQYYKEITISNSGGALSDYQVLVQLSSSNFPANARSDGADIRFTDATNNELSYWIESWDYSGRSAKIWVKVPNIPASAATTIRMYYGNPSTGSSSNGTGTFDLFDNFDGASLDTSKWDVNTGANYAISGGNIKIKGQGTTSEWHFGKPSIYSKSSFNDYIIGVRVSQDLDNSLGDINYWLMDATHYYAIQHETRTAGADNDFVFNDGSTLGIFADYRYEWNVNEWVRYTLKIHSSVLDFERVSETDATRKVAGINIGNSKNFATTGRKIGLSGDGALSGSNFVVDWIFVRKYASPEPSVSVGAEQTYSSEPSVSVGAEQTYSGSTAAPESSNSYVYAGIGGIILLSVAIVALKRRSSSKVEEPLKREPAVKPEPQKPAPLTEPPKSKPAPVTVPEAPGVYVKTAFGYKGAAIIYKLKIENNTSDPISDIKVYPYIPDVFLLKEKEKSIALIEPKSSQTVTFEIRPTGECGDCNVSGRVNYYNTASRKRQDIELEQKSLSIVCPMLHRKEISEDAWRELVSGLIKAEETTTDIPMGGDGLFDIIHEILKDLNLFALPPKITHSNQIFSGTARFYGEGVKGLRYAAQIEVVGGARKSKLILKAWAEKEDALTGFYHGVLDEIEKRVKVKEYIDDSIVQYNVHIGDKIGTLVKDSVVQRSNIGASSRKCPNCGREVEANEKFCLECGAKL